ncbi:HAD-like protein [Rhizopogon salebrosus TDB-379]|nr:HAD-like protein [Rhizopogon salebrosus TDB-379]
MVLSHEDDDERHPYWYARVVRIFHLDIWNYGTENAGAPAPLRMHVLFVRWFGRDVTFNAGWSTKRLHRLGYFKGDDPSCFGFLDPDQVIRGVHLVPAFAHGRTEHYMGRSFVRREEEGDDDWRYFYVNMFVDRDMFMRFRGGGVGHKVTREWDDFLQSDGAATKVEDSDDEDPDVDMDASENADENGVEDDAELDENEEEDDEEEDPDKVMADSDEELDDDVLAREGKPTSRPSRSPTPVDKLELEYIDLSLHEGLIYELVRGSRKKLKELAGIVRTPDGRIILGATTLEDKLQEGVPEAIEMLHRAGIKLWILTGDKVQTAIDIEAGLNKIASILGPPTSKTAERGFVPGAKASFAVVIDRDTLRHALTPDIKPLFLNLGTQCETVVCCRVSPTQKALTVKLVKEGRKAMSLSIGDGTNDVAMIHEANIGCGLLGHEGSQTAMSAGYAFGQFTFLTKLLLVHGRWSYRRIADMHSNLLYKNVIWTLAMFWFMPFCYFDVTCLYDYSFILFYTLIFTSLPVIVLGDCLYQSAVVFFIPYLVWQLGLAASHNGKGILSRTLGRPLLSLPYLQQTPTLG